jgi:uncharacterized protein (DUF1684 family)
MIPTCRCSQRRVIRNTARPDRPGQRYRVSQLGPPLDRLDRNRYVDAILADRLAKDAYYRTSPDSPFRGAVNRPDALSYFEVDPGYRIVLARLRPASASDQPIELDTSDGNRRLARRRGFLDFMLDGQRLTLTGLGMGSTPHGSIFVPFQDLTSGRETYGGGRYLDLEPEPDGSVVLDFNRAYHPYCAYSGAYSCPLTPSENRLPVPIHAGERQPS